MLHEVLPAAHPKGGTFPSSISYSSQILQRIASNTRSRLNHQYSKTPRTMRFDILAACMIAYASSSLAAPFQIDSPKGGACLAPSRPDRKVNAYPAKHPAPPTGIAPPGPPKGTEAPDMHEQEHRGPAVVLPLLHRKITVPDRPLSIDA